MASANRIRKVNHRIWKEIVGFETAWEDSQSNYRIGKLHNRIQKRIAELKTGLKNA